MAVEGLSHPLSDPHGLLVQLLPNWAISPSQQIRLGKNLSWPQDSSVQKSSSQLGLKIIFLRHFSNVCSIFYSLDCAEMKRDFGTKMIYQETSVLENLLRAR